MKVAVMSLPDHQCGKSSFMVLLGTLFAHTQAKSSALLSTDKCVEVIKTVQCKENKSVSNSIAILSTVVANGLVTEDKLYNYAMQLGKENCFLFDLFDSNYDRDRSNELLLNLMARLKSELVLIEVKGNYESEFNQKVLQEADLVLCLFNMGIRSFERVAEFYQKANLAMKRKTGFVCMRYDPNVISEKAISKRVSIPQSNIMLCPYNVIIPKLALSGKLDTIAGLIAEGNAEVINLRPKMVEVMQYIFDSSEVKYIKPHTSWYK